MTEQITFAALSVVLVGSALAVVLSKILFHAVLWLALALPGTAGIFLLLDAEFLAAVQLLLYAGGIITIVVFAIVVTERLIGEHRGAVSRGETFGVKEGCHLRIAYGSLKEETVVEGIDRLVRGLKSIVRP